MHMPDAAQQDKKAIAVAVGVLRRADGCVLVGKRVAGQTLAGYLEFPGGKIEKGESPAGALVRELDEELGIRVEAQWPSPLIRFEHTYPAFSVHLHVYRLDRWDGEPAGREGQSLAWITPSNLHDGRMLPANRPILNALSLPDSLLVTPLPEPGAPEFLQRFGQALGDGPPGGAILRLRDPALLDRLASSLADMARERRRPLILNSGGIGALPPGFSGLHVPAAVLGTLEVRPRIEGWIGASVHSVDEAVQARRLGLDYVVAGSVRGTPSHPGFQPLGWHRFGEIAAAAGIPTYAIGGVGPEHLDRVREQWGHGIAAIRAFWPQTP